MSVTASSGEDAPVPEASETAGPSTIPEAMEASGATWRQVHHWIQKGWLRSSREGKWAHGLSPEEVDVARVMVHLIDAGLTAARASHVARQVLAAPGDPVRLTEAVVLTYSEPGGDLATEGGA